MIYPNKQTIQVAFKNLREESAIPQGLKLILIIKS